MSRRGPMLVDAMLAGAMVLALAGCQANRAPGNDTEAALDPPQAPAPRAQARDILATAALDALQPETMDAADLRSVGASGGCRFLFTRDAFPSFAYGVDTGFLKLNAKLVPLARNGEGHFASGGLDVAVVPLQDVAGSGGAATRGTIVRRAQLVMRAVGLREERGYRGYLVCGSAT